MRLKLFGIIGLVFAVSSAVTWVATVTIVQSQYINIESANVEKDTSRAVDALNNSIDQLALKAPDWGMWDDTYKFITDRNQAYMDSNLQGESLQNLGINFMLFYNKDRKLVISKGVDVKTGDDIAIPKELAQALAPDSKLLAISDDDAHKGLLGTKTYPLLIATSPILHSDTTGPYQGTLVFAQFLLPSDIAELGRITHLKLGFYPALDDTGSPTQETFGITAGNARTQVKDHQTIFGRRLVNDIYGKPLLVARVDEPRQIFQQTQQ
ncbi:MAG: CHASE4 domain-containing protein, partial [Patescibacteria group bacterium]